MAERLSNQMKELNLVRDKILDKSLETELNFCMNVKDRFLKTLFDERIVLKFMYGKISINLFFLSEKRF